MTNDINQCQIRHRLSNNQGSANAEPRSLVETHYGTILSSMRYDKTSFSSSEGTIFGLAASKRENRQEIPIPFRTVLSKRYHGLGKGFSSERTIYWQPAFKGGSFPLFKTLFQKMKSAVPAAIKWSQGRYFHKGSITEHAFHFKLPTGNSVNKK